MVGEAAQRVGQHGLGVEVAQGLDGVLAGALGARLAEREPRERVERRRLHELAALGHLPSHLPQRRAAIERRRRVAAVEVADHGHRHHLERLPGRLLALVALEGLVERGERGDGLAAIPPEQAAGPGHVGELIARGPERGAGLDDHGLRLRHVALDHEQAARRVGELARLRDGVSAAGRVDGAQQIVLGAVGVLADVTDHRQIEEAVRRDRRQAGVLRLQHEARHVVDEARERARRAPRVDEDPEQGDVVLDARLALEASDVLQAALGEEGGLAEGIEAQRTLARGDVGRRGELGVAAQRRVVRDLA